MAAFLKQLASPRVLAVAAAGAGAIVAGRYYLSGSSDAGAATGQSLALCMLSNRALNLPPCTVRIGWGAVESENVLSMYYLHTSAFHILPPLSFLSCLSFFHQQLHCLFIPPPPHVCTQNVFLSLTVLFMIIVCFVEKCTLNYTVYIPPFKLILKYILLSSTITHNAGAYKMFPPSADFPELSKHNNVMANHLTPQVSLTLLFIVQQSATIQCMTIIIYTTHAKQQHYCNKWCTTRLLYYWLHNSGYKNSMVLA